MDGGGDLGATDSGTEPSADLAHYAFTDRGPWVVDRDELGWLRGIDVLRATTRRQVPLLTGRRRLPDIGRLAEVSARMLAALVPWLVRDRRRGGSISRAGLSRRLRVAAEHLGPTYIKLAQIISSGEGLFPPELVEEFRRCRDQVRAEDFETVRSVIEADLGCPLEEAFSEFDREPLAAASIAQVHAATLSTGEEVVVKVQRPTIRTQVHRDLKVMSWLAPFLVGRIPVAALANPPALVELFAETISEELDFRLEAENMLDVAASFAALGQRGYLVARPHPTLVTRRVLVMERLHGFAFEDLESMKAAEIDTHEVIRIGVVGFTEGCMVHGIFHGDLHAGNLFVTPDGRIALMDFGITARMTRPGTQRLHALDAHRSGGRHSRADRGLPRSWCTAGRHRHRRRDARARAGPGASGSHLAQPGGTPRRDTADHQGPASHGGPDAEDPHAVRQEPCVPRRCHRTAGS